MDAWPASWIAGATLATCLTAGAATAEAAAITNTGPISSFDPDVGGDVLVRQFDSALGTLTGVSVSLTGQFTPRVTFDLTLPSSLSIVTFSPDVQLVDVGSPTFAGLTINAFQYLDPQSVSITDVSLALGTPEAVDLTTTLPVMGFAGPGNLDFYLESSSGTPPDYDRYTINEQGMLTGQVAVTYTYTPSVAVPEPASLALLGVGLLGLCAVCPRRR